MKWPLWNSKLKCLELKNSYLFNRVLAMHVTAAQVMCEKYRKPLEAEFGGKLCIVELSLLEKALFVLMRNWIERNLKKDVPTNRHVCVSAFIRTHCVMSV